MAVLTRDAVLAAHDLPVEIVPVPEWGGEVKIRGLTLAQRVKITELSTVNGKLNLSRASVFTFIYGVIEPQFSAADYESLREKSALIERIAMRVMKLSGIGQEALESAVKNSEATPGDDLPLN